MQRSLTTAMLYGMGHTGTDDMKRCLTDSENFRRIVAQELFEGTTIETKDN